MARLPAVVDLLSGFDGRSTSTLEAVARHLREAELLPPSRSGAGAAHLSPEDAATLLIAVLGNESATAAHQAVERYADLTPRPIPERDRVPLPLPLILREPFHAALAGFLRNGDRIEHETERARFHLTLSRPFPVVELRMRYQRPGEPMRLIGQWTPDPSKVRLMPPGGRSNRFVDKVIKTTVTEDTLFALSQLIMSGE